MAYCHPNAVEDAVGFSSRSHQFSTPRDEFVTPRTPKIFAEQTKLDSAPYIPIQAAVQPSRKEMQIQMRAKLRAELFSASRHGRYEDVENILRKGIPVDSVDEYGNSILLIAAQNGNKRICKIALRLGADITLTNKNGQTCLHYCFAFKHEKLGEYLISKGADDTLTNKFGLTCYDGLKSN